MTIAKTGLTANVVGAALLVIGISADPETIQQVCSYLELLGIIIAPTKITAVLGLIGLVINQVLLQKQKTATQVQ